jgi:hypothetical protein
MEKSFYISIISLFLTIPVPGQDSLRFSGQLSSWANLNFANTLPLWGGVRYIPRINYLVPAGSRSRFDAELSANIYGTGGLNPFDTISVSGNLRPYRAWIRYSSEQFEIRFGLQKLNFGSAAMIRPLMWFDQLDPRDPLQLTSGVWGILGRYYFLNNANLWLWGLYGNNERRGWELIPVNKRIPEFGGRIQLPVPSGEVAFSYHHRVADSRNMGAIAIPSDRIPENKYGFDAKWDLKTGIWIEASLTEKSKDIGILSNQLVMNAGIDYTFALGSGLYVACEQLLATYDKKPFSFSNQANFTLVTSSYPLGLFDKLSTIIYYNWTNNSVYSFLNWQRQFEKTVLYVMAYWNPDSFQLPAQTSSQNIFAGKGIQIIFVYNH